MNSYRIIEPMTGKAVMEKSMRGDKTAQNWLNGLLERGVITGIPVKLQKRVMTDEQAATLPPFATGKKQSPWRDL